MTKRLLFSTGNNKAAKMSILTFSCLRKKNTTSELRRQIRIELAKRKSSEKEAFAQSRQSDNALFHRLIRKQRVQSRKNIDELVVGEKRFSEESVLSGFHEHFKTLASKKPNQEHDKKYLQQMEDEVSSIYQLCLNSEIVPTMVTSKDIQNAAKLLNRGKAADVYGVTAEHIYYGGQELLTVVKTIINNFLLAKDDPPAMKLGILNPIFKNKANTKESQG